MFPKRYYGDRFFARRYFPPTLAVVTWVPIPQPSESWNPDIPSEGIWTPIPNPGGFGG